MSHHQHENYMQSLAENNLELLIEFFEKLAHKVPDPKTDSLPMALYLHQGLDDYVRHTLVKMGYVREQFTKKLIKDRFK